MPTEAFPSFLAALARATGDSSPSVDVRLCREVLAIVERHPERVAEQVREWLKGD